MSSEDTAAHVAGMLAAGVVAAGLVLGAWALAPKSEPEPVLETETHSAIEVGDLVGRWSDVNGGSAPDFVEFTPYGSWFGSDGCNGGSGTWTIEGGEVHLASSGIRTLVACDGGYLPGQAASGTLNDNGDLEFTESTDHGGTLARVGDGSFSLTGVSWVLQDDKDPAVAAGMIPGIGFNDDGTWSGTDGCNRMSGTWSWQSEAHLGELDSFGAVLQLDPDIASTRMACEQESSFPKSLTAPHWFAAQSEDSLLLQDRARTDDPEGRIWLGAAALE